MTPWGADGFIQPHEVGMFEAEKIASLSEGELKSKKAKRMIKISHPAANGLELPEQGTWHYERKKAILKAHPEIKEMYGTCPWTFLAIVVVMAVHTCMGIWVADKPWWLWLLCMYTIGTLNAFQLQMLGHDAAHGLICNNKTVAKFSTVLAFTSCFVGPFGSYWLVEHMWHHNIVVDKSIRLGHPTNGIGRKIIITLFAIAFINGGLAYTSACLVIASAINLVKYFLGTAKAPFLTSFSMRPFNSFPQILNRWTALNILMSYSFFGFIYFNYGFWSLFYFLCSISFSDGLHPLGMRMIQEHYVAEKNQPTYSVYSPFSWLLVNVGYHTEHHDFPLIPWTRLPAVRKTAPEYYDNLKYYTSYTQILIEFFTNKWIPVHLMFGDENPLTTEGPRAKST